MTRYTPKSDNLRAKAVKGLPLEDFPPCDTPDCSRPATQRIYGNKKKGKRGGKTQSIICCHKCAKKILKNIKKINPAKKIVQMN